MKKILPLVLIAVFLLATQVSFASTSTVSEEIEYLPDGSYYVTIIEDAPSSDIQTRATKTVTKTKTTYYKNTSGKTLWWVKVTGTFTYGNGTSKCTSAKASAASENSSWKVSNISSSRSGNTASATATGKQYLDGKVAKTLTKKVTLKCSSTGVFS